MKKRFTLIFLISCLLFPAAIFAQDIKVTGKVTDQTDGGPLPGVTVTIEGTSKATLTDNAGKFTISAPAGSKLSFRLIGMTSKTVTVTGSEPINVTLGQDTQALSEVVVVGYGTQKKTVVSGAISGVKAADLENQPVTRVEQSLQGRTSGLTVASTSGSPGAASTVRLRGFTSFGGSADKNNPLWVVDGVVVDNGGIGYLNQSDIESIDVLKDAASAAIYGARSAAGVILVTTKKGKEGNIRVNYSGYYGTAAPAKKLDLLNATQYAQVMNQGTANSNADLLAANPTAQIVPLPYANPAALGQGTNWQDLIFNDDARKQNHEVSISGGNEKSTFYTSFGYSTIDGIVATAISKWKRANIRLNSTHKLAKWLTFGENLGYSHSITNGVGPVNREFGGPLSSAINLSPTIPAVITTFGGNDPTYNSTQSFYTGTPGALKNSNGNYYTIPNGFQEMTNPLAYIQRNLGNYTWDHNIVGNAYLEAQPIKGLKLRSAVGTKLSFYGNDAFTPISYLGATTTATRASLYRAINYSTAWNIENTATYTMALDKNHFTYLIGQGYYKDNYTRGLGTTFNGIPATTFYEASMAYTPVPADITTNATEGTDHVVTSLFARAQYDYDEKYLFTALVRRDGSSRFGANHKYGYFPSFSVGWVPTREDFLKPNDVLTSLKIRGSYGITGNDGVGDFAYAAVISPGRNYPFGKGEGQSLNIGYSPAAAANPDLKWEQTS
ncbi:MAG TPA: SusC/RagA family TonB-linked outer membrane protein, partial [Pedobacter sp.]